MLNETVAKALNEQINHELYASYLYLSMAAAFEAGNLPGFARWMRLQSQEENVHAMKLFDYVIDRGGRVALEAIQAPPAEFGSPLASFEAALEHERRVTGLINRLYGLAGSESDFATQAMLQWFLNEQVEEEKTAGDIVEKLKLAGDNRVALLMLDQQLGGRQAEAGDGGAE